MRALHTIQCIQLRTSLRDPKNKTKALEAPFQSEGQRLYELFRRVSRLLSRFLTWWEFFPALEPILSMHGDHVDFHTLW